MRIKKLVAIGILTCLALPAAALAPYSTLSGGVTSDERAMIDSGEGRAYSLKLEFAKPSREYVTDVQVTVQDASGKQVVSQKSEGPYFLIALPAGSYTVNASAEGQTRTQKVDIKQGAGQKTYTLRFDVP